MKKAFKAIVLLLLFLVVFPSLAGVVVMELWNNLIPTICGFATITFLQSVGLFFLGQLLTGGFLVMIFVLMGCLHKLTHHHGEWHDHWHKMTDEERREFILKRREHFGVHNRPQKECDDTE